MLIDVQPKLIEDAIRNLRSTARDLADHYRDRGEQRSARHTVQWKTAASLARALKQARANKKC
jgi:hypothetical protein